MRSILSVSLPQSQVKTFKQRAVKRGFSTMSSYVRFLMEQDDDLITESQLLKMAEKAKQDYRAGKLKKAAQ